MTTGERYRITVVPDVGEPLGDAGFRARSIAGEAWDSLPHKLAQLVHGKRVDSANWFALIGTIDKTHPWVITDGAIVTAPATGTLTCYFNDVQFEVFYRNNSGWVVLDVERVTTS
jgi:hypothetical protein